LDGEALLVPFGGVAQVVVTAARPEGGGPDAVALFLVEPGDRGLSSQPLVGLDPTLRMQALRLEGVRLAADRLIGEPARGRSILDRALAAAAAGLALQAVGGAGRALAMAVEYAQVRQQFGRPIGSFQGVAFMIADMATEIEAARSLVYRSAWLKDQGRDYSLAAAQAKLFASEVSSRATNAAIQVHGGYGYVTDYPVERYLRDAKLTEIGEGTSQVQRLVIARRILGLRIV
jgi:alkylation response protein AidB-like acyl-CoA dehydrogenase